MGQDIRKMLKDYKPKQSKGLPQGHEARFAAKLETKAIKVKKQVSFNWLKIAAIVVVFLSVSYFGYQQLKTGDTIETQIADTTDETPEESPQFTLGDISPDLKKVEEFYMNGINVQLASLKMTGENKDLTDGYMLRIKSLDEEYAQLNKEMNKVGPSEETITALIDNLKLRLELLFKLKNKLKELKNLDNEQFNSIQS